MSKSVRKSSAVTINAKGANLARAFGLAFYVTVGRPQRGDSLRGFTCAWMTLAGMQNGASIPRKTLQTIVGASMVSNHASQGNLDIGAHGVRLTQKGFDTFALRAQNPAIMSYVDAWTSVFSTGNDYTGNLLPKGGKIEPIAKAL